MTLSARHRKQSLYLPTELLLEVEAEAERLQRSMSWIVQHALRHGGLAAVKRIPSLEEVPP